MDKDAIAVYENVGKKEPKFVLKKEFKNVGVMPFDAMIKGDKYINGFFISPWFGVVDLDKMQYKKINVLLGDRKPVLKVPHFGFWSIGGDKVFIHAVGDNKVLVYTKDFKFIKNMWFERIAFEGKAVKFKHFYEYNEWAMYVKKQKNVFSLIKNETIDTVLNKAVNHEKVVNSKFEDLLIVCEKSKIMFVFNKKNPVIKTVLDLKKSKVNKHFSEKIEKIDFGFVLLDDKSWIESFADFSDIYYMCDKVVWLNSI